MRPSTLLNIGFSTLATTVMAAQQSATKANTEVAPSVSAAAAKTNIEYQAIDFDNFGYDGSYYNVEKLTDVDNEECTCTLSTKHTPFEGVNAPINQELSVHFRGPLILHKFAAFISDRFILANETSGNWTRNAYYDGSSQTSENVTFLTAAGENSTCLGKAITYADSDGLSKASDSTILAENTLINSDDEFMIMSNVSCGSSGYKKDCGVYRDGIPAMHGFYGDTKMFLFEFEMPTEDVVSEKSVEYYDMPAIWLLNANIPRTAQYPTNSNCSCWTSGCGEFDIFEALNTTEANHLYSTIHDYQGTGLIDYGLSAYGYIKRDPEATMKGGVIFDSNGTATVFLSNSTTFDSVIQGSDIKEWVSDLDTVTDTLVTVKSTSSSTSKSSSSFLSVPFNVMAAAIAINIFMFVL